MVQNSKTYDKFKRRYKIGQNIRKYRLAKGITQEALAQQISLLYDSPKGGNPQTVYRIENGRYNFGIDIFLAISEVLQVSPEYLLHEIE